MTLVETLFPIDGAATLQGLPRIVGLPFVVHHIFRCVCIYVSHEIPCHVERTLFIKVWLLVSEFSSCSEDPQNVR